MSRRAIILAAAENSRMLRVVASVPVLSFPPPPKPLPLGFHRGKSSLLDMEMFEIIHCALSTPINCLLRVRFSFFSLLFVSDVLVVFLRQDVSACVSYLD